MEKKVTNWPGFCENTISMLLTALDQVKPVEGKLAAYLMGCTVEEQRNYFKDNHGFDPLIVTINEKLHVFEMRHFIDEQQYPLLEHKAISINFNTATVERIKQYQKQP